MGGEERETDMKSLAGQFADWVRQQEPAREYDYCSNGECAFAQFLFASGYAQLPVVGPCSWHDQAKNEPLGAHEISPSLGDALSEYSFDLPAGGRTFGALAERLAKEPAA